MFYERTKKNNVVNSQDLILHSFFVFALYIYIQQKEYWKLLNLILVLLIHELMLSVCVCVSVSVRWVEVSIQLYIVPMSINICHLLPSRMSSRYLGQMPPHPYETVFFSSISFKNFTLCHSFFTHFIFHRFSLILINPYTFIHLD